QHLLGHALARPDALATVAALGVLVPDPPGAVGAPVAPVVVPAEDLRHDLASGPFRAGARGRPTSIRTQAMASRVLQGRGAPPLLLAPSAGQRVLARGGGRRTAGRRGGTTRRPSRARPRRATRTGPRPTRTGTSSRPSCTRSSSPSPRTSPSRPTRPGTAGTRRHAKRWS